MKLTVCCLILVLLTVGACQQPATLIAQAQPAAIRVASADFDSLWEESLAVLRSHRFRIDRQDRRAGVITTHPETSQHFFEFWRRDVARFSDWIESSLQTTRRRVRIEISTASDSGDYEIVLAVHKDRYSVVERQIANSAAALRVFSAGVPTTLGEPFDRAKHSGWAPMGRDAAMEQVLRGEIAKHFETRGGA